MKLVLSKNLLFTAGIAAGAAGVMAAVIATPLALMQDKSVVDRNYSPNAAVKDAISYDNYKTLRTNFDTVVKAKDESISKTQLTLVASSLVAKVYSNKIKNGVEPAWRCTWSLIPNKNLVAEPGYCSDEHPILFDFYYLNNQTDNTKRNSNGVLPYLCRHRLKNQISSIFDADADRNTNLDHAD